jgi:plasmid replication initiation protein
VQAQDIARLFRELKGGENGSAWIMASARRLRMSGLDWQDHKGDGTVALLSGLIINKETGTIYYEFPIFLIERLLDNQRFSRLRLHFMIGLSGKYSVSLYMLLEGAANLRRPIIELTVDELRDRLSVPNGKLEKWFDLNRFAIDPALKQINDNPIAAGFSVACEPILKGRKVERVRLTVIKSA